MVNYFKFANDLGCSLELTKDGGTNEFSLYIYRVPYGSRWTDFESWDYLYAVHQITGYEVRKIMGYISKPTYCEIPMEVMMNDTNEILTDVADVFTRLEELYYEVQMRRRDA